MKNKIIIALILSSFFLFSLPVSSEKSPTLLEVTKLTQKKKYLEALKLLNEEIQKHKKPIKLITVKVKILLKLNRYKDALSTSIKSYSMNKRKSPWRCMDIVSIYLKLKNNEAAFKWLEKAIKQGFLSYSVLHEKEFDPLRKGKRFRLLIKKIKDSIGIGKPAKDFTATLISGRKLSLSKLRGKVILIDFWATWCSPCIKGFPHLKTLYKKYKNHNFEIIGISLDEKKNIVKKYISKEQIKWKITHSGKAWFDDIAKLYKVSLIPSYWIIDKKGILRDFGIHLRDEHKLKQAIEKLL